MAVTKQELTQKQLLGILVYDPVTGIFTQKVKTSNRVNIGDTVGSLGTMGYLHIRINYKLYLAHRLAWLYIHGTFPDEQIDHINGVKTDNRLSNLRAADYLMNSHNQRLRSTNTSGFNGVTWYKQTEKWRAQIKVEGKAISIGYFTNKADAIKARMLANIKHGFHPNHGIVANHGCY